MVDAELLDLLKKDPEKGLNALIAQYGELVYTVMRRNLPESFCVTDIEACAVEVFSEFYLDLNKYDPSKGSIKAWLCVIARHNAIDTARRDTAALPLDEEIRTDISGITLESDLEERKLRRAVLSEVKLLDEPDREILLRKFYLDESSFEGNVYLSAYAVPKQTDEGCRHEIANILNYVFSRENWEISSEEQTPMVRDNYTAVLLLYDPNGGEPKNFYSVKGSIGGTLAVENDQLKWNSVRNW